MGRERLTKCFYCFSEPSDDETYMKIERKLSRNLETAAKVENGPKDCSVIKGFPISLCCKLGGSPPLKVRWNKDENEVKSPIFSSSFLCSTHK